MSFMGCSSPEGQRPSAVARSQKTLKIMPRSWNQSDKLCRFDMVRTMEPDAASGSNEKTPKKRRVHIRNGFTENMPLEKRVPLERRG
jgi:hypothetical protein